MRHEEGARKALLARLATDLAIIAEPWRYEWTCCWLAYNGPHEVKWTWEMCGGPPGGFWHPGDNCGHWHHQWEVFMA